MSRCLCRRALTSSTFLGLFVGFAIGLAEAQEPATKKAPPGPPPPENLSLETRDGIALQATYYAGRNSKQTPPVVLLHDADSTRRDYAELALLLQTEGCAVLAVDLRGFGDSTTVAGRDAKLDAKGLPPAAYEMMARHDLEALRRFLVGKNNEGVLNLDKLGIVASGFSTAVAMLWTQQDWRIPPLATGKQGQDVKALVLISPQWRAGSLRIESVVADGDVQRQVSKLIAVGGDKPSRNLTDAQRMYEALARFDTRPRGSPDEEVDVFLRRYPTTLQGTAMLGENLGLEDAIVKYFRARLITPNGQWSERKRVFEK